jgi:hypothetical protein
MRETKELWLESLLLGTLDLLPPFTDEIHFHSPDSPRNFSCHWCFYRQQSDSERNKK